MKATMKRLLALFVMAVAVMSAAAQGGDALEQIRKNPQKAYGTDCPYPFDVAKMTKAPKGYKPFYISHYARHGSRYYWSDQLYKDLDTLLTAAHIRQQLTSEGEKFYRNFMDSKEELTTGVSELTQLGWEQHQGIARVMYNNFPEVFKKGGNVLAVSSLVGRCVLSMSAFCQELVQCNPKIEIREQSSRFTLDAVVPDDRQNPVKHSFPRAKPRFEKNWGVVPSDSALRQTIVNRAFKSTEGLPGSMRDISSNLINLYTSLPSIAHEGMMGNIVTDDDMINMWERSNMGTYGWVFGPKYQVVPILQDFISKADAVINGTSDHVADLRFGHDSYIGPLTVLMGINGADLDPEDPFEVKNCYQNWETCKACNIQLVFYRGKKGKDDIIVKCLLNGLEATLPVPTTSAPYYKWADFRKYYGDIIREAQKLK